MVFVEIGHGIASSGQVRCHRRLNLPAVARMVHRSPDTLACIGTSHGSVVSQQLRLLLRASVRSRQAVGAAAAHWSGLGAGRLLLARGDWCGKRHGSTTLLAVLACML